MAHDSTAYTTALQQLSPRGEAWPRATTATFTGLLRAFADALARVDQRVDDMRLEQQPLTAFEMLPEWEYLVGEPDACSGAAQTLSERRQRVYAKLTMRGGQSAAYFTAFAAVLGFEATVEQYRPAFAGLVAVGDPLWSEAAAFDWTLIITDDNSTIRYLAVGDGTGEPLATWGNGVLECTISRYQPTEGNLAFAYRTRAERSAGMIADFTKGYEFSSWPQLGRLPRAAG